MHLVVSICLSITTLTPELFELGPAKGNYPEVSSIGGPLPVRKLCLCVCNQMAYADNLADVVDWH